MNIWGYNNSFTEHMCNETRISLQCQKSTARARGIHYTPMIFIRTTNFATERPTVRSEQHLTYVCLWIGWTLARHGYHWISYVYRCSPRTVVRATFTHKHIHMRAYSAHPYIVIEALHNLSLHSNTSRRYNSNRVWQDCRGTVNEVTLSSLQSEFANTSKVYVVGERTLTRWPYMHTLYWLCEARYP